MDRLNLTLFGLDREQEAAIKELFEARGWDYVHEISLPLLNFDETFLARTSFAQPSFATYDTAVASVEPETERQVGGGRLLGGGGLHVCGGCLWQEG